MVEKILFLISYVFCLIQQVLTGDCSGALLDLRAHELGGHEPGDGPEPHREEEDEDGEAHQGEELELLGRRRVSVLQVEENACEGMNLLRKESHPIYLIICGEERARRSTSPFCPSFLPSVKRLKEAFRGQKSTGTWVIEATEFRIEVRSDL